MHIWQADRFKSLSRSRTGAPVAEALKAGPMRSSSKSGQPDALDHDTFQGTGHGGVSGRGGSADHGAAAALSAWAVHCVTVAGRFPGEPARAGISAFNPLIGITPSCRQSCPG